MQLKTVVYQHQRPASLAKTEEARESAPTMTKKMTTKTRTSVHNEHLKRVDAPLPKKELRELTQKAQNS